MIKLEVKKRMIHRKPYFYRVITAKAFYDSRLSSQAKLLLMHLLASGEDYTPTILQLAKDLSTSERTISRAANKLCEYGYMTSTPIGGKKNGLQSWWIYEIPDYMEDETTAQQVQYIKVKDRLANANAGDSRSKSLANANLANAKIEDLANANAGILYNRIDCGGVNATPQSTNEEKSKEENVAKKEEKDISISDYQDLPFI
jgi:hypothetical protein